MTLEEFKNAVTKGLGRAVLCVEQNDPTPYVEAISQSCLFSEQLDPQCESRRAPYLMWLVERAGIQDRVLGELLTNLTSVEDSHDWRQRIALLAEYAKRGNEAAWSGLVQLAKGGDEDTQDCLAEIGVRGLLWLVEHVMPALSEYDSYRPSVWLSDVEESGDPASQALDPQIRTRIQELSDRHQQLVDSNAAKRQVTTPTVRETIDLVRTTGRPVFGLARVSKQATDEELLEIAGLLLVETDRRKARTYASAFRTRAFPLEPRRLIEQVIQSCPNVALLDILGDIESEEVRQFARSYASQRPLPEEPLAPLVASFQRQDIDVVDAALLPSLELDSDDLHSVVLDLLKLGQKMTAEDRPHILEWIFDHSPCSFCRASAVDDMIEHKVFPERLIEEAKWDAEPDIRKVVAKAFSEPIEETAIETPLV